ncbi:hypothetical protein M5K25_027450 [Dendrobium thyrsiflorum]|uniref:Uncharacterized protein n=1 Tax=Dendrobium thyrsiflorum TaxID=117978 RepID=A0ABD0U069_DENTH
MGSEGWTTQAVGLSQGLSLLLDRILMPARPRLRVLADHLTFEGADLSKGKYREHIGNLKNYVGTNYPEALGPARNYEPNDTKIDPIRAQMSPDQGPEALLEGLKRDSDYQTVFKLDKLIVESSGSTRQIQRAQEHRIPTSLSQEIIRRTV